MFVLGCVSSIVLRQKRLTLARAWKELGGVLPSLTGFMSSVDLPCLFWMLNIFVVE